MIKKIIAACLLICVSVSLSARYPFVRNFKKSDYNAGSQSWCIQQDAGRNIWFANSGILEYDGSEWAMTRTGNMTTVRSLYYDGQKKRMYFGAANEFGYININDNGLLEYTNLKDGLDVTMEDIWAIHQVDGVLWLRESRSMYAYDFQNIRRVDFPDKISTSSFIDGTLYISVNHHGVYSLGQDGDFTLLTTDERLKKTRIISILEGNDGGIWMVTQKADIYLYKDGILSKSKYGIEDQAADASIYCAATDGTNIALGTVRDGVYIINRETGIITHMNTSTGMQNNTVLSMMFDRNGDLWLGLDNGIDQIKLSSAEYRLFGNSDLYGAGYASEVFNGKLWIGTNQGLYTIDADIRRNGDITDIKEVRGQVWSLLNHDGFLFCCHDAGLYIFRDGKVRHLPMNGAWKLERLKGNPDFLLGSSYDRMFLLKKSNGEWDFDCWIEGFEEASKAFEEDKNGTIWFYHWIKGLFKLTLDIPERRFIRAEFMSKYNGFPEDWSNIPVEFNGKVIFTTTDGYYGYDYYSEKAYNMSHINCIFKSAPQNASIYMTSSGDIYFSSGQMQALYYKDSDGRDVMDSLSLKGLADRRIQGFEDIRCLSNNEIMVNTDEGFSIIHTGPLRKLLTKKTVQVYIKSVYTREDKEESPVYMSFGEGADSLRRLNLKHTQNSLRFKAGCPIYEDNGKTLYSFMLENYDKGWSKFSSVNQKEYTGLPHGRYTFRVRASSHLHRDASESSLEIHIAAPWYLSWAAIIGYMIIGMILLWSGYRYMEWYSTRRAKLIALKKENELRRKQMQRELEHKAQDLAASTMNVIRKNEILLEIDASLVKATEYIAEDRNKSLKLLSRIRHDIKENIQHDDVWQKFEKNFDIVYDDLLKRLGEAYPHLTMSDKKMCAYLKMSLSSKDIAPLLNMTVRSVEMSRYRLRKKLGLSREDNLTAFLDRF